jgi:hypothetical protein
VSRSAGAMIGTTEARKSGIHVRPYEQELHHTAMAAPWGFGGDVGAEA